MQYKFRAFGLVELLITLAVFMLGLMVAIPSYRSLVNKNEAITAVNQLVSSLEYARAAAIQYSATVTVCASRDGEQCAGQFRDGLLIFVDRTGSGKFAPNDIKLRAVQHFPEGGHLSWNRKRKAIQFGPLGDLKSQNGTFYYCPANQNGQHAKAIILSMTGRIRVVSVASCS